MINLDEFENRLKELMEQSPKIHKEIEEAMSVSQKTLDSRIII